MEDQDSNITTSTQPRNHSSILATRRMEGVDTYVTRKDLIQFAHARWITSCKRTGELASCFHLVNKRAGEDVNTSVNRILQKKMDLVANVMKDLNWERTGKIALKVSSREVVDNSLAILRMIRFAASSV